MCFFSFCESFVSSTLEKRNIMESQSLNDNEFVNSNCRMLWVWTKTEQAAHSMSACCKFTIVCCLLRRFSTSRLVVACSQACKGFVALLQLNRLLADDQFVLIWFASHLTCRWHRGHVLLSMSSSKHKKSATPSCM